MLNDNAKALINKLQYIIDRFVKVRTYSTPKRIVAEPHNIEKQSDNKYIVFFGEIVSDKTIHAVNVYKEPTTEQPVPDFPEYVLVDRQPLRANECYVDRENNLLYFHSSQVNCKVSVTYYSIGVGMLSSALIYTHFDSNNKVIETLYQLTRRCQEELDRISTVNDAEQLKVELRSYIDSLLELMRLYPNPKEIIAELETIVANADDLKFELGAVVEEAQRFLDELKTGSNKTVTIAPSMWTSAGSGRYSYEYWHNLNTTNLIITTTQIINGIETSTVVDYEKTGNNKIKFYTSDNSMTVKVVMSASYFPGILSGADIGVISADNLTDGFEKVAMTVEERETLAKSISCEDYSDEIINIQFPNLDSEVRQLKSDVTSVQGSISQSEFKIEEISSSLGHKAYKTTVSPEEFGAVGDGATDDSQAIQTAINSLTKGGTVVFSPKTYLISNGIIINNKGITLKGTRGTNGNGTVIISNNSNNNDLITIGYGQGSMMVGGSIEDISIMGNSQRQSFENRINKNAIYIKDVSEFNFKNVYISGFIKSGVYAVDWWDSTINSLEIRACGTENTFAGLQLDCDNDSCNSLHFFGLHIEECPFQLKIDKICSNIHIVGSKFERGASAPINNNECLIFIYEGVYNITFDSCFFTSAEDVHHILVKNNYTIFNACTFSTGNAKGMMAIKHHSANANYGKGIVINGCVFDRLRGDGESILLNQNDIFTNNKVDFLSNGNLKGITIKGKCNVSNNIINVLPSYTGGVFYTVANKGNVIRNNITTFDDFYSDYVEKKSAIGSEVVSFPSICSELLAVVKVNNNAMTIKIIPSLLESTGSYVQFMGTSFRGKFLVTSNTIKLNNMYDDSNDVLSSTNITIYVKY